MKKVTPTPKEIFNKCKAKHPIMKIPLDERSFCMKKNILPEIKLKKKPLRKKDRDIKDFSPRNPYDIPRLKRTFFNPVQRQQPKPEPFIMSEVHTICDFYTTFFKEIEGRPLRRSDDIKVYISNIRDVFLFRANAAYLLEQIIRIDAAKALEMEEYKKIDKQFTAYKDAFIQFAKVSYNLAVRIQGAADIMTFAAWQKMEELAIAGEEFVEIRNRLLDIMASYEILSMYRRFLDKLSPIWWATENVSKEIFKTDARRSHLSPQDSFTSSGSIDFNDIVNSLKKVDSNPYFQDPQQLLDLFEDKRRQCLNYLHLSKESAKILSSIKKCRDAFKIEMQANIKQSYSYINTYKSRIKFEQEQEVIFRKLFYKILYNKFHELYGSYDAIKLFTCVQYVHTKLFNDPEDPKDELITLMSNIERHYMDLSLKIEALDLDIVHKATNQAFAEDIKIMKKAEQAQRIIKESDILTKSLYTSFEPPRIRKRNLNIRKPISHVSFIEEVNKSVSKKSLGKNI